MVTSIFLKKNRNFYWRQGLCIKKNFFFLNSFQYEPKLKRMNDIVKITEFHAITWENLNNFSFRAEEQRIEWMGPFRLFSLFFFFD